MNGVNDGAPAISARHLQDAGASSRLRGARILRVLVYLVLGPVLIFAALLGVALIIGITSELWVDVGPLALVLPAGIVAFMVLILRDGRS